MQICRPDRLKDSCSVNSVRRPNEPARSLSSSAASQNLQEEFGFSRLFPTPNWLTGAYPKPRQPSRNPRAKLHRCGQTEACRTVVGFWQASKERGDGAKGARPCSEDETPETSECVQGGGVPFDRNADHCSSAPSRERRPGGG